MAVAKTDKHLSADQLEMAGTISGMKITYLGYYCSNSEGMTQLLTYTGTSAVEKYRSEMEDFLNGLVVKE